MGIKDFLNKMKVSSTDKLSQIEDEAQAIKSQVTEIETEEAGYEAELKAQHDAGFEAGLAQAGQAGGDDKIYSDAELNESIAAATTPLQAQIDSLTEQVSQLQAQVDGQAEATETAKTEAVTAYKAELLAQYEAQQVVEQTSETGFADLLK